MLFRSARISTRMAFFFSFSFSFFFHPERNRGVFLAVTPPFPSQLQEGHAATPRYLLKVATKALPVPSRPVPSRPLSGCPRSPRSRSPLGAPQPCAAHGGHLAAPELPCPLSAFTLSPKPRSVERGKRGSQHPSPSGPICSHYGGLLGCCLVCGSARSNERLLCATELGFHPSWMKQGTGMGHGVLGLACRRGTAGT